jgi:uncharacterized protein YutE (UPF0331/DUF86 family)
MVFKPEAVRERLKRLEEVIARLSRARGRGSEAFLRDPDLQWIVERGFILAAECVVDVASHVLSGRFKIQPADHESAIQRLGAEGVISAELTRKLRGLGGFRNILVHDYLILDPRRVKEHLETGLEPLEAFVAEVTKWLAASGEGA